jgi:hypothetical protein
MSRSAARGLHIALVLVGLLLYLMFVLPRWWVLTGDIPTGVATAGRLAAGIPIALAALPVFAILRDALGRTAKTPELALRLRAWSAVLHIVAGGLILLAAIVEIWLRLGVAGPYLFAVYGAAASIAILAVLALYLSFVAEKPPAEPKPPKPPKAKKVKADKTKSEKTPRGKKKLGTAESADESADLETTDLETTDVETTDVVPDESTVVNTDADADADADADTPVSVETDEVITETTVEAAEAASTGLRNKRPAGKRLRRLGR